MVLTLGSTLEQLQRRVAELEVQDSARDSNKNASAADHKLYRTIVQTSLDGFWINDMEGRLIDVNEAYCRLMGYSREELLQMRMPDVEALEKPEETARHMRKVLDQGHDRFETRHRRKNGEIIDLEISATYLDTGGGHLIAFLRDITDRKKAQEALAAANQQLGASNQQLSATEQQLRATNQQLEAANQQIRSALRRLGERVKELHCLHRASQLAADPERSSENVLRAIVALIPPACQYPDVTRARITLDEHHFETDNFDETAWKLSADIVLAGKKAGALEVCYLEEGPLEHEGPFLSEERDLIDALAKQIAGFVERKRAEEEVTWLAKFPSENPNPVLRIAGDGTILYSNLPSAPFLDAWGSHLGERLAGKPLNTVTTAIKSGTAHQEEIECGERTFVLTFAPAADADYVNVYGLDITGRRRVEGQLRQSQKMDAIGQLAGGVAHDFNNLLMVMMGCCDFMTKGIKPDNPLAKDLAQIKSCGERATALTRQLLAFSRRQTLQPEVLDLNELVANLNEMLQRLIGEDITLVTAFADDLGRVQADSMQVEQIIMNLAVNARDAMPKGGKLIIETANTDLDEKYASGHVGVVPGRYVMLAISDTGRGMNQETKDRLFEPFFTTKEKGKGTGLGLSTVYGIVKQSGGNIWAYAEPGQGTTLKVYLPRTDAELVAKAEPAGDERPGGGKHVLVVEDEPILRDVIARMLERLDYHATVAANGREALIAVQEKGLNPDVILSDVVMPGMSGEVLTARLRKILPDVKVLYMSGYTNNVIAHHGVLDPGTPFIQKPFNLADLAAKIEMLFR